MAVEAICDKCNSREKVKRYTLSINKRDIPRNEKPHYSFIYSDGVEYSGPEYQTIIDLCDSCHCVWNNKIIEAVKI